MDAPTRRRDDDSEGNWPSEDISVLGALLDTPTRRDGEQDGDGSPVPSWASSSGPDDDAADDNGESKDTTHPTARLGDDTDEVVVTALKRQVQLLQQEYDRHLELRVAKSVVAAGGRSAPRASTIKLYRQYERLARVATSLEIENQRLAALLVTRQQQHHTATPASEDATPFRVARQDGQEDDDARIPRRKRGMFDADAKQPAARRPHEREEMPSSSGEEK